MLEIVFGNKSAEKVMMAIYRDGELHASAIAKNYQTALDPIKKQLEKFEEAGFLKSRIVGRSKLYKFNNEHPLVEPLKEIIKIAEKNNYEELRNEI